MIGKLILTILSNCMLTFGKDEPEECPSWADPVKWEKSKI